MMNSRLMSSIVPADCILFELLTVIGSHRTSSAEDFKSPRRRRARVPRRQGALQRRAARRAGLADKSVHAPRPEVHAPIGFRSRGSDQPRNKDPGACNIRAASAGAQPSASSMRPVAWS
ncbi:unnamed protein product [Prorocentrum cordatum]|uniref:Uncharacterized protein n=1 Tax=Prorocentrum cordatum TaxID=2364126 RepID=A0ABN9SB70_9DINO|nr:unnamed protein product [Polarella glacialis]